MTPEQQATVNFVARRALGKFTAISFVLCAYAKTKMRNPTMTKAEREKIIHRLDKGNYPPHPWGVIRDSFDHIDALEAQLAQRDERIRKLLDEVEPVL